MILHAGNSFKRNTCSNIVNFPVDAYFQLHYAFFFFCDQLQYKQSVLPTLLCTPFMSYMQLRAKDIGLDSSQLECLIRVTGVAGSIPGPSIYFYHLFCSFLFSNYNIIIQTIQQCTVNQFLFATTLFRDSLAINWFATTKFRE